MLGSASIMAFAPTTDLDRAHAFFGDTLGLALTSRDPIACVYDADGTPLRVTLVDTLEPPPFTVLGWIVADIHATVAALSGRGVTFQRFDGMGQDDDGVWTAPGGDQVAWFRDPDGNTLSLTEVAGPA